MDPQAAWQMLLEAYVDQDWERVAEVADGLFEWLTRGGFAPETVPQRRLPQAWNQAVARAACLHALARANAERLTPRSDAGQGSDEPRLF